MSVILTRMDEAIMLKKRYFETGAAVKPEASMPNDQTEDEEGKSILETNNKGQFSEFAKEWGHTSSSLTLVCIVLYTCPHHVPYINNQNVSIPPIRLGPIRH